MQKVQTIISALIFFTFSLFSFAQNYKTFNLNKVMYTVDSLKNLNSIKWLDSLISVKPNEPIISAINGNPPFDPYRNPWSPSSIYYWYFYLPYSDTLTISISDYNNKEDSETKKIFLKKGKYILKSDTQYYGTKNSSSIYIQSVSFCGSTFRRKIFFLK